MAKLAVPPIDPRLRSLLLPVLAKKHLNDDVLWKTEISPLICSHLEAVGHSVRQSATTNANAPATKIVDEIHRTLGEISRNLARSFAVAAPFTIHRVAELLLSYHESGYSLTTVISAQKWLSALARAFSVSSSESSYNHKRNVAVPSLSTTTPAGTQDSEVSEEECRLHNLPPNIRFVRLNWEKKGVDEGDKTEEVDTTEPASKRLKPSADDKTDEIAVHSEYNGNNGLHSDNTTPNDSHIKDDPSKYSDEFCNGHIQVKEITNPDETSTTSAPSVPGCDPESPSKTQIHEQKQTEFVRSDTCPEILSSLLIDRTEDTQDPATKNMDFYDTGSIDYHEQKRRKEEVSI
ncbi:hypothetical protein JCM33374_g2138 [Metschnikowia sp. JCM 33374]|nr:hypothetical protein JCM33374_g2138 [Metschnikowia sp. JCM 33374]